MRFAQRVQPIAEYRGRSPRARDYGLRTDVRIFASRALVEQIRADDSLDQAANVATLPGIVGSSLAMPDIHQGYGFPIGGVCATDPAQGGVVSPGGVGFDINCGVRLLRTNLGRAEVKARIDELIEQAFRDVPCGTGGAGWMTRHGYGPATDAERCEAGGSLPGADPDTVSPQAKQRGRPQLGTLGSGNHFMEVQYVESIHDAAAAQAYGLEEGQVVVLIHSGSRGLGHQVCTDALKQMGTAMKRYGIELPDRQLACVPADSPEGRHYLGSMRAAANFAWANRQAIAHFLRTSFAAVFGARAQLDVVYDVCHNIAKLERHEVEGGTRPVLVHRKGATRAFPPGHAETPAAYRDVGQPVFIPGSMGTASWVLAGQAGAMRESFGTCCHGAGRLLSRKAAKHGRSVEDVLAKLGALGVVVRSETRKGLLEEIPEAYKDVDEVIAVVHGAGLAKKVARLRPMGVIKG